MSDFITFEGPEGSGKSTQAQRLKETLEKRGYPVLLTREPGGTPVGDAIREILLDPDFSDMEPLTELFLYEANRNQHVNQIIRPALKENKIVLSDRFHDASLIYQGAARNLGLDLVKSLNDLATESLVPDLTFVLDVETENGLNEARGTDDNYDRNGDRIEQESNGFHETVRKAYRKLTEREPERCKLIPRSGGIDEVHRQILEYVEDHLPS
jgi:dTMP kinase